MKLLIDINIVLDVVLARTSWAEEAANLLSAVETGSADGYVAGHTVTTLHYIVAKQRDRRAATAAVSDLLGILAVVPLAHADFQRALLLGLRDFEDAVQTAAALRIGADYLITRNTGDFTGCGVDVRSAGEVLALL